MLNILRMEWYRMLKSKSTWVTLIVFAAIMIFITLVTGLLSGNSEFARSVQKGVGMDPAETIQSEELYYESGDMYVSLESDAPDVTGGKVSLTKEMPYYFQGNGFVLFIVIFMGIFATGHTVTGFRKNLAGIARPWQLVVSDFVMCLTYSLMTVVLGTAIYFGCMAISYNNLIWGAVERMLAYLLIYTLLNAAIGMLAAVLSTVTRNRALAITAPLIWVCMMATIVYELVNLFVRSRLDKPDFNFYQYMPYGNIVQELSTGSPAEAFVRAAVSGVVFILVFMGLNLLVCRKQDIK